MQFDHGAQYFTAPDNGSAFSNFVIGECIPAGIVREWTCSATQGLDLRVVNMMMDSGKMEVEEQRIDSRNTRRYVAVPDQLALSRYMVSLLQRQEVVQFDLKRDCAVAGIEKNASDGQWKLLDDHGSELGHADVLVLACTAPDALKLIQVASYRGALKHDECLHHVMDTVASVRYHPCWSTVVAFQKPLFHNRSAPDGLFVNSDNDRNVFSWISHDRSKPGRADKLGGVDTWVLHGSTHWSEKHLHETKQDVQDSMMRAFRDILTTCFKDRIDVQQLDNPLLVDSHLWKESICTPLAESCLYEPSLGLGLCGDWLGSTKVSGAFESGFEVARIIQQNLEST